MSWYAESQGPILKGNVGIMAGQQSQDPWKHRSVGMRCGTCMWFVPKVTNEARDVPANGAVGRCRRHAPTMNGFPVVFERDWCGDHRLDENKA